VSGGFGDLYLASTSTPGMPTTLASGTKGALFGNAYTGDSSHAIFYPTVVQIATVGGYVGPVASLPVMGGGMPKQYAKQAWVSYTGAGSMFVYNDNLYKNSKLHGQYDLFVVDVSKTDAPVLVGPQSEGDFFISPDNTQTVFAVTTGTQPGIYTYPLK
jgi:hypothetical protein